MKTPRTALQILRQERSPLVVLTGLAFAVQLVLAVVWTGLAPLGSGAAPELSSLCSPSGFDTSGALHHDPATCQCGPICSHGCGPGPLPTQAFSILDHDRRLVIAGVDGSAGPAAFSASANDRAIRAPPLSGI